MLYGVPSRVRTDRGGEKSAIWVMMNMFRGFDRGSALRGRSTHNQRTERLWGDLWRGMTNVYYDLFQHLESEGIIDVDNEVHMWALHYIYLPRINSDLTAFATQWNNHGLRTERHMSPLQIFVRGCLQQQSRESTAMQDIFGGSTATAVSAATTGVPVTTSALPAAAIVVPAAATGVHATNTAGGNPVPILDWPERVTVPTILFTLEADIREQIQSQIKPSQCSKGESWIGTIV